MFDFVVEMPAHVQASPRLVEDVQDGEFFPVTMFLLVIGLSLPPEQKQNIMNQTKKADDNNVPGKVFCVDKNGREITLVVWKSAVLGMIREFVTRFVLFCTYKFVNMEVKRDWYKGEDLGACLNWNTGASKAQLCSPQDPQNIPLKLYPKTSLQNLFNRSMKHVSDFISCIEHVVDASCGCKEGSLLHI